MKYITLLTLLLFFSCSQRQNISKEHKALIDEFESAKENIDLDNYEKSVDNFRYVLKASKREKFHYLTAKTYTYIGWIFDQNLLYKKAYVSYSDAINYWEKSDSIDYNNLYACYNNIGLISKEYKDFDQAIQFYNKAEKLSPFISNSKISNLYYNTGTTYFTKGDENSIAKAEEYLQKALKIAEKEDHKDIIASVYYYIGYMYSHLGDYEIAEMSYKNALKFAKENDLYEYLECSYHGLGLVYSYLEQNEKAVEYLNQAIQYNYDKQVNYSVKVDLGNAYLALGENEKGINILESLLNSFDNIEERSKSDLYSKLAIAYQKSGNTDKALAYISENNKTLQGMIASADYVKGDYEKILFKDVVSEYEEFQNQETFRNLLLYTYLPAASAFISLVLISLLVFRYQKKTKRKLTAEKIKSFQVD